MKIDLQNDLFLCPAVYDSDPLDAAGMPMPLEVPDRALHFTEHAARMLESGSSLICMDSLPADLLPAEEPLGEFFHFRTVKAPDGKEYIPLFLPYQAMIQLFGNRIHIGVVSFADARRLCISEPEIAGIVVAPGILNQIITREMLMRK